MKSKITGGNLRKIFTASVLGRYEVGYYQCLDTGFIQTDDPFWLSEAYSSAITSLDLGLLARNQMLSNTCEILIQENFNPEGLFIDYAGGYGTFTRMMRDRGYNFKHQDKFCENLFARQFDVTDKPVANHYELATAFEVFEHFEDPMNEIVNLLNYSDSILFSTELIPNINHINSAEDWWYFVPETGQHIAFYTKKSLEFVGAKLEMYFYSNGKDLHLFSRKSLKGNPLERFGKPLSISGYFLEGIKLLNPRRLKALLAQSATTAVQHRKSLLNDDFNLARQNCRNLEASADSQIRS